MTEKADKLLVLLKELHGQAISLQQVWRLERQLYGNRTHVELMQASAFVSFGLIQGLLQEAIFLGIQRFLDPASAGRHKTASLERVLASIPHDAGNAALRRTLGKELKAIQTACADIKERRNRQIAHLDYQTVLQEHPTPLNSVQIRTAETAINGIVNFLRQLADHCYSKHHSFAFRGEPLDADRLMHLLDQGLKQHAPLRYPAKRRSTDS